MARNVGIYISKNSVDLVDLESGLQGLKVLNSIRVPVAVSQEAETVKNAYVEALKSAASKANLRNIPVIAVMPSRDTIIRHFQMPILPAKERHKAILFEAKKYIPFKLDEVASDYSIADVYKKSGQDTMDLVFAAVKKEALSNYISYFDQADIRVKAVEPAASSLLRWYKLNFTGEEAKSIGLLEFDADSTFATLTVIKRNIPCFVREINLPKPLLRDKDTQFNKDALERLVSELHISFEYYKKWFQGEKVEKIVLFSQAENLPLLLEALAKETDIPLESGTIRKGLRTRGYLSSELYLATGAALRDKVKSKVKLNLYRPPKAVWFEGKRGTQKAIAIEIAAAFLILVTLNFIFSGPVKFYNAQLKMTIASRPQPEGNIDLNSFEALKQAKESLAKKQQMLDLLIKKRLYWTPYLAALVKTTPEGLWVTDLELDKKKAEGSLDFQYTLTIKAKALLEADESSEEISNKFLDNLTKDRYFSNLFKDMGLSVLSTQPIGGKQLAVMEVGSGEVGIKPYLRRR